MARLSSLSRMRKTNCFVQYDAQGNRHIFSTEQEAIEFAQEAQRQRLYAKVHSEAQRQADEKNGSLVALVCNPNFRLTREL